MNKNKKRVVALTAFLLVATVGCILYARGKNQTVSNKIFAMDTAVTVTADKNNINTYIDVIKGLDKKLSAYDENSEISKLNREGSGEVSEDTAKLLIKAKEMSAVYPQVDIASGNLIRLWNINGDEPRVPHEAEIKKAELTVGSENLEINGSTVKLKNGATLDLGSCAKGYALDVVYDKLKENKEEYAVVSFGSSGLLFGKKPDGQEFNTEILDPDDKNSGVLSFKTGQCFISTSGGYERYFEADGKKYCHIIDLNTGSPVETDLTSVTVISKTSGTESDFMSTCIFMGGTEKINEYLKNEDFEVIALDNKKNIFCSESIKDKIEIKDKDYSFK